VIDPAVIVSGDPGRLQQVLWNLLTNAVKFTPAGGQITLTLKSEGTRACISVKDNGIGIPRRSLEEIFQPFVQGDHDNARSAGGLGLGLSLVQQLVAMHGGEISVYSAQELTRGSEFVVSLPIVAPPGADIVAPPGATRALDPL